MNAMWNGGFICGLALASALGFAAWGLLRVPAPVLNLAQAPQATAPHRMSQPLEEIRPIKAETNERKRLKLILSGLDHGTETGSPSLSQNLGMEIDRREHIERIRRQHLGPIVEPEQEIWTSLYAPNKWFHKAD
jgi:hypothetical protein